MLPNQWEKRLIDCNVQDITDSDICWADMVFISGMIVQKEHAKVIISRCNQLERTVVAGGPLFFANPKEFKGVHHFVLGEAEATLPLFLRDLEQDILKRFYRSKKRPDITKTPIPDWSLINMKHYANMTIQYSRGCPFNCEFCDIVIMNGRIPRTKYPAQIVAELQSLYDSGWRSSVFMVDDNFIGNKVKVKELLPYIIRWQKKYSYPFTLVTEASVNLADDEELLDMMSRANFSSIFLGLETTDKDSLKECGKYQNVATDLHVAVKKIQGYGMHVMGGFIVGFDHDTDSIFESQIKFIQKVGVVTAMVGLLTAMPHTKLYHRLKKEGRLIKDSSGENTIAGLNFVPKMGTKKLIAGYKKILSTIYKPRNYYKRINTFIKNYRPTVRCKMKFSDIIPFLRSVWRIGIISRSRFRYWKLIMKTAMTKRKALPLAIELAVYGQHFEKFSKKVVS
jgi:radical SAM superfamily enzyme YgiQ (UPF0313 family)